MSREYGLLSVQPGVDVRTVWGWRGGVIDIQGRSVHSGRGDVDETLRAMSERGEQAGCGIGFERRNPREQTRAPSGTKSGSESSALKRTAVTPGIDRAAGSRVDADHGDSAPGKASRRPGVLCNRSRE